MKRLSLFALLIGLSATTQAGNKIKYYFTQPVNNAVSKGENAVYLNDKMGDTIVAYINRAKYTLDIAVYNYTSTFPAIAVAANNAHNRGVRVRWIYDSSSSNTGIPLLASTIARLASPPDAGSYSIMHNKFMIIDANSTDAADPIVWTGSTNWNSQQFNYDYNNAVVIQDQALAKAYQDQFNMMWGGTGDYPNHSASKFGQYKTDLGAHHFTVDGKEVEVYFSPADGTNDHIQSAISSANTDLYWAMCTFTYTSNASLLAAKKSEGLYVAGVDDQSSNSYSPYSILMGSLGSSNFKIYSGGNLYHHKYVIVDASNSCSDPMVVTGSHNWTSSANTMNDENTLIIHDATAANIYYQSFSADFSSLGGSLTTIADCNTGVAENEGGSATLVAYPSPTTGAFLLRSDNHYQGVVNIRIVDVAGRIVAERSINNGTKGIKEQFELHQPGLYLIQMADEKGVYSTRITVGN